MVTYQSNIPSKYAVIVFPFKVRYSTLTVHVKHEQRYHDLSKDNESRM